MSRYYFLALTQWISINIIRNFEVFPKPLLIFSTIQNMFKNLNLVRLRYLQFALETQSLLHFFDIIETLHSILSQLYYRLLNKLIQEWQRFLSVSLLIVSTVLQFGGSSLLGVICEGKVILFMRNVLIALQFKLLFLQLSYRFVIIAVLISIFEIILTIVMI